VAFIMYTTQICAPCTNLYISGSWQLLTCWIKK